MRKAHPYLRVSFRTTLTLFIALVLGAIALLSLGTKPAETKPTSPKPPYIVQDLGTLGGSNGVAFGINNADQVVGASGISGDTEEHAFLWTDDGDPNTDDMKDLGTLGGSPSQAAAINEAGKVVGTSDIDDSDPNLFGHHAFFYEDGQGMRDLGTLGGDLSDARDINDTDKVVGTSTISGESPEHAYLYSEGVMRDLGTLGGSHSQANAINNADQVVGPSSISGDTESHAYLWTDDGGPNTDDMKDLGTLGGSNSNAFDINEAGKVVGFSFTTSGSTEPHAYLYSSGQGMTDLGTLPGRISSIALGINNDDQVVGSSSFAEDTDPHPFLYSGGVMRDLNTLIPPNSGWELREAFDINDNGHIVGRGSNEDGENRAFLLVQPGKGQGPGQPR
jgi:probable HAF family extracellular repeat protein